MRQILIDLGRWELLGTDIALRVYGYGLMLVLGFLSAIFLAQWRARRMGENPEVISMAGIVALVAGVFGARIAYVIEKWDTQFADSPNLLLDMVDITSGGLIYYGGLLLATLAVAGYLMLRRVPLRRYLDIVAPSLMLGLAFGRMGCLLNGCCFGGLCDPGSALAMEFPMYSRPLVKLDGRENPFSQSTQAPSPPYAHQLAEGIVEPDHHLLVPGRDRLLIPPDQLHGKLESDQLGFLEAGPDELKAGFAAVAGSDHFLGRQEWRKARLNAEGFFTGSEKWALAMLSDRDRNAHLDEAEFLDYVARRREWLLAWFDENRDRTLTGQERAAAQAFLQADELAIAEAAHAHAIKPAQPLGLINALLLAVLLNLLIRRRRREGQVFAVLLIAYPITRFLLELIRSDNPHDLLSGQLTHNQWTSIVMVLAGAAMLAALQRAKPSAGPTWNERLEAQAATTGSGAARANQRRKSR
jgi:prolipoprotein diacylglyceryltransferase